MGYDDCREGNLTYRYAHHECEVQVIVKLDESIRNRRKLLRGPRSVNLGLAIFILVSSTVFSQAHLPTGAAPPPAKIEPAPVDPLERETPRSAMMGLLKYEEREDYENAARYLQPPLGRKTDLTQRAKEFRALQRNLRISMAMLSDDPNGTVEPGLPPGQVRAGVVETGETTEDVILVRVDDPSFGKIWLVSKETVANIPALYAQIESEAPTPVDRIMPAALTGRQLLGMSLAKWVGWLLSIPIAWLLTLLLTLVLTAPLRIRSKIRKVPFRPILQTQVGVPLKCIIAILIHSVFVYLLEPPLLYRVYYFRLIATLLVGCLVWLIATIGDRGFEHAVHRARSQQKGGESILIVMQRLTHIILVMIALLVGLALFGFNVTTTLAGLGIGGLAIALAAQKSLENLIGGVSLLMDKAVQVGDFCQIGNQLGTVEDIGLRSLKLRTLDQNLSVVPNGSLAQMQFQNMARRSKLLINQTFALRIETEVEQLRFVLDRVQSMLDQHPAIEPESCRVRVTSFVGAAFQLELFAYGQIGDWKQFTAIRQDVILKIAEIVEASGTRFAAPTQLTYLSRDAGLDAEKTNNAVRHATELRASDIFRFPGEARTGTK
jgi:MscS family membrane protein